MGISFTKSSPKSEIYDTTTTHTHTQTFNSNAIDASHQREERKLQREQRQWLCLSLIYSVFPFRMENLRNAAEIWNSSRVRVRSPTAAYDRSWRVVYVHTVIYRGETTVYCIARIGRSEWRTRRTLPLDLS